MNFETVAASTQLVEQNDKPVLATQGVSKQYGPVTALHATSLSVRAGEIRALVGENGSGKSTFVGIVSGTVVPTSGAISIGEQTIAKPLPVMSQAAGVLTVFQDGSLLSTLTVAQNLYIGTPPSQRPKFLEIPSWAHSRLQEFQLDMDPLLKVSELAAGDRQLLEIVRAVMARPRVLILDESTSALDASGVDRVLNLMRVAAGQGAAVIFVTHRLSEVFRVADTISVLRDGHDVGTFDAKGLNPTQIVELMAGTKVDMEFPARLPLETDRQPAHVATGIAGDSFGPIDLSLLAGEIVGIAGADGNGQEGLLRGLAMLGVSEGHVETADGTKLNHYRSASSHGVIYVSGDRRAESLFQPLSIRENLVAGVLGRLATIGIIGRKREQEFAHVQIKEFGIRLGSTEHLPGSLSGGNQQKIAISKALATEPKVLLIYEPTQGVDVRSRMDIYRMLRACADEGNAVVMVSSDASELAGVADRVLVMSRGRIVRVMPGLGTSEETIVEAFAVESVVEPRTDVSAASVRQDTSKRGKLPLWFRNEEVVRLGILALFIIGIGTFAATANPNFLSPISLRNVLLIATPLACVAIAQYFVLLIGGIDVSVGATMALSVVVMSYLVQADAPAGSFVVSVVVILVTGAAIGLINAFLVERLKLSAVIATIATLGIVGGVALTLRPTPKGAINYDLMRTLASSLGVMPAALIALVVVAIAGDIMLRRTGLGMRVRAVGMNGLFANRLGIRASGTRAFMYVLCGMFAAVAGILLAGQVGIGDATVGDVYTLLAIAAPVLGGASLLGGRGTLIGVLLGAILLGMLLTLATVIKIDQGANLVFIGVVTLGALITSVVRLKPRARKTS